MHTYNALTVEPGDVDRLGCVVKAPQSNGPTLVGGQELATARVPAGGENVTKVLLFEGTKNGLRFPGQGIP